CDTSQIVAQCTGPNQAAVLNAIYSSVAAQGHPRGDRRTGTDLSRPLRYDDGA
ncbi:MAG: hypothetical protein QOF28_3108, partial [Actinomycetota bacterium]|nr:hypothetical protein [Actinomycetota bacterium]